MISLRLRYGMGIDKLLLFCENPSAKPSNTKLMPMEFPYYLSKCYGQSTNTM